MGACGWVQVSVLCFSKGNCQPLITLAAGRKSKKQRNLQMVLSHFWSGYPSKILVAIHQMQKLTVDPKRNMFEAPRLTLIGEEKRKRIEKMHYGSIAKRPILLNLM